MDNLDRSPVTLIDVLANSVVLRQLAPYIPIRSLLALSATNKSVREYFTSQPEPWRHLDLTGTTTAIVDSSPIDVGGVSWRAERMDESLTEDDFYAGPLRGIFGRLHQKRILGNVQTLVLDGLSVPADLVREIVAEDRYRVKILSLRECGNLNPTKLQQVLRYITRPTRAEGTPRLKALYFFGRKDTTRSALCRHSKSSTSSSLGVMESEGAQIGAEWNRRSSTALSTCICDDETKWYGSAGKILKRPLSDWPDTLRACKGLIAFDAVLCRGPRHDITKVNSENFLQPSIATVALGGKGCESCGSCPEGPAVFGECSESMLPLLSPPPSHSSTVRAAQYPQTTKEAFPKLLLRCEDCLRGRWCERCNRWWCEDCYKDPVSRMHMRTEMQQLEAREDLREGGWETLTSRTTGPAVKVYSKLCVEHCLVGEMMSGAGSNGMWG
ncbi:hypothetical protein LTR37_020144 [Vermiconidia calcicola]|uniref:Uncharacterized protein n=1 Tax=Vermiconidia calcicola TaxID=1690605 RepID=A0ACC3ME52_9PEZI|nr:hypothetical protein LTR37_020144 [Vermiconidia calcicola]